MAREILLDDLPFVAFIVTFVYAIVRSKRKIKTALMTCGAVLRAGYIALACVAIACSRGTRWSEAIGIAGPMFLPFEMIVGIATSLVVSAKTRDKSRTEASQQN